MKMHFGLGVLAHLAPTFALGFVCHLVLFHGYYEHLAIYRKDIIIPFGFLSMLIQAFVFAWVYQQAYAQRKRSLLSRGLTYSAFGEHQGHWVGRSQHPLNSNDWLRVVTVGAAATLLVILLYLTHVTR